ncbi:MAG: BatD family protein [Bacteroidetes bacterium]|nr:BatD family protein [Fibrella sp.]
MKFAIFRLVIVLFFCYPIALFGQTPDNAPVIELGITDFSIERPFTVSVILPNSTTRPTVVFPDITGLSKRGTTANQTTSEVNGKNVVSQVITQDYLAQLPGTYQVAPFVLIINGVSVRSPGTTLTVRPAPGKLTASASTTAALALAEKGGAFLSLTASQLSVYEGQGIRLRLTFYAAENYPYELRFDQVEQQLQTITNQIRPPGAWEESTGISELKPVSIRIKGRPFREYVMYQSTFFPLRSQTIRLPAVTLTMQRIKLTVAPVAASPVSVTQTEPVSFASQPVFIVVRPLPTRVSTTLMPVGTFRLVEQLARSAVAPGQSTTYEFRIEGEGNIAAIPPPMVSPNNDFDVFPPTVQQVIDRTGSSVTGQKSFRYFIVPKRKGQFLLGNTFQWVYFNPQTARYDTLRSRLAIGTGGRVSTGSIQLPDSVQADLTETNPQNSIYKGISQVDSTYQPLNFPVLVRAAANVLIVVMMAGMIYVFYKK